MMKNKRTIRNITFIVGTLVVLTGCKSLKVVSKTEDKTVPSSFATSVDTTNVADLNWKDYFDDPNLISLIDTALMNNQELNIVLQEIVQSNNEIMAKKGAYLPSVEIGVEAGSEKVSRYTSQGASDDMSLIAPGIKTPEILQNYGGIAYATWEIDIWHKLRNDKKASYNRFLASVEGKNFVITNLIGEVSHLYYELLALDSQMDIVKKNIEIQTNALEIMRFQKDAAKVTELAVKKFEAEVFHTRSLQFDIRQEIVEVENRINFLLGRYPQPITRNAATFTDFNHDAILSGIPTQLLENRPDVRKAEFQLIASKLDVKVARARFYPSLRLNAGIGGQSFNPAYLIKAPQALLFSIAGSLAAPVINRKDIKAAYFNANARQIQAVYNYERTVLNAYLEVVNMLSNIDNLASSFDLKSQQVEALNQSILITNDLFTSARADYMEVLLTQRDALSSKFELIETQKQRLNARVSIYKALGGGWK